MTEMKNSTLLEKILEYAKGIGDSYKATMTAERYLLAVIDYIVGDLVRILIPKHAVFFDISGKSFPASLYTYYSVKEEL